MTHHVDVLELAFFKSYPVFKVNPFLLGRRQYQPYLNKLHQDQCKPS